MVAADVARHEEEEEEGSIILLSLSCPALPESDSAKRTASI